MKEVKWTKDLLCNAINQRVDRNQIPGSDYLMPLDITEGALDHFQTMWDRYKNDLISREREFEKLYQAIIGGF